MATKFEIRQRSDDIVAMVEGGAHIKDVAKHFSIKPTSVTSILRKRGVTWRKGKFSKSDMDAIKGAYLVGATMSLLAEQYSVAEPTILHLLRDCGVSLRTPLQTKRMNSKPINSSAFSEDSELCAYLYGWILTDGCMLDSGGVSLEINRVMRHGW